MLGTRAVELHSLFSHRANYGVSTGILAPVFVFVSTDCCIHCSFLTINYYFTPASLHLCVTTSVDSLDVDDVTGAALSRSEQKGAVLQHLYEEQA